MRWDTLRLTDEDAPPAGGNVPLLPRGAVTRQFDTPEFRGITFHEVTARSALNKVPEASKMPFRWTINPYRGCSHACKYCFARKTHEYLELDSGHDFDSQIVVKTNVGEVLRRELAPAVLARRAHRHGHQRRLLPACRGSLSADAADPRGAA